MSHINFQGISGRSIAANYDLPDSQVVIVNKVSGQALSSPITPAAANPDGRLDIHLSDDTPGGEYYLKALDASGKFVAESVTFYVASGDSGPEL